jgi:long-chain acyl-CoA synthetase
MAPGDAAESRGVSTVLNALVAMGDRPALTASGHAPLRACDVLARVEQLARALQTHDARCAAVTLENGPDWVIADLACQLAGIPMVPVPGFFTPAQSGHICTTAGVDTLLGHDSMPGEGFSCRHDGEPGPPIWKRASTGHLFPPETTRITFTSGTTGTPRGVCLPQAALERVAGSLAEALSGLALRRHLVVLPLSVLLENVAGVYAGLLLGMEIVFPEPGETGLSGSSSFLPAPLIAGIRRYRPQSLILLPQMLKAIVARLTRDQRRPNGLEFVAVGGARTAPELIRKARALGIPAYEGYGLTECGSVVAVNTPCNDRPGSVGKVLPHQRVRLSGESEILLGGDIRFSYLGDPPGKGAWLKTGDLGFVDDDGFLHVSGRKQDVLVTAFGRNVSPEWVESELLNQPGIEQAVVVGDELPALIALIAPVRGATDRAIAAQVGAANARLPDYARVTAWRRVPHFSTDNSLLTPNGRPRRHAIVRAHSALVAEPVSEIEQLTTGNTDDLLPGTYAAD